jgi:hypothetical protein
VCGDGSGGGKVVVAGAERRVAADQCVSGDGSTGGSGHWWWWQRRQWHGITRTVNSSCNESDTNASMSNPCVAVQRVAINNNTRDVV